MKDEMKRRGRGREKRIEALAISGLYMLTLILTNLAIVHQNLAEEKEGKERERLRERE